MRVKRIGQIVNDGVNYWMWLEQPYSQPSYDLQELRPTFRDPRIARARRQAHTMTVHIEIKNFEEADELREAMMAELDTSRAAVMFVVCNDNGLNERYRYVVAKAPAEEQPQAEGMGVLFVATLVTHGDVPWTRLTETVYDWTVTGSGQQTLVENPGSLEVRPVITLTPRENKPGDGSWSFRRFVAAVWDHWRPFERYSLGLAWNDGELDTYHLMQDGKITSEDEIGVIVDGMEVRRWIEAFNTTESSVWVNLDFQPGAQIPLGVGFGAGDEINTITVVDFARGQMRNFPVEGLLLIGDEVFFYRGVDEIAGQFLNVQRASRDSTAAAHSENDTIHWLQHDIWLVYGGRTRRTSFDDRTIDGRIIGYDGLRPMIDLLNSSNNQWIWDSFFDPEDTAFIRPLSWRPRSEGGFTTSSSPDGSEIGVNTSGAFQLAGNEASWTVPAVRVLESLTLIGERYQGEVVPWRAGIRTAGPVQDTLWYALPGPAVVGQAEQFNVTAGYTGADVEYLSLVSRTRGSSYVALREVWALFQSAPYTRMMPEFDTYSLNTQLENLTTGVSLWVQLETGVDQPLVIDTGAYTVTAADGSNQYQAIDKGESRAELFPLAPGTNVVRVIEPGLAEMDVQFRFRAKSYS